MGTERYDRTMRAIPVFSVVAWLCGGAALLACSCAPSTPCSAFEHADIVVAITVQKVLAVEKGFVTRALAQVDESWKGHFGPGRILTVSATPWCNVVRLEPGSRHIIYARSIREENRLATEGCFRKIQLGPYEFGDSAYLDSVKAASHLPRPLGTLWERWSGLQECFVYPLLSFWLPL